MKVFASLKHSAWLVVVVVLWAAVAVLSLVYLSTTRQIVFDHTGRIASQFPMTLDYLHAIQAAFAPYANARRPLIIRLMDSHCRCNTASRGHWQLLQNQYPDVTYSEIDIRALPEATQLLIPATPMAVFIDVQQQALYAGPFSDGVFCGSQNSLIEAYVAKQTRVPFAPLLTQGCYCPNESMALP